MHNAVLNRFKNQIRPQPAVVSPPITTPVHQPDNPPVSPEKLKEILMAELQVTPESTPPPAVLPVKEFPHIWSFVEWYEPLKDKFTPDQQTALNTLVQTRDMVTQGCGCRRQHREAAATEYFKSFWLNNQTTDLPETVRKIAGADVVKFAHFLQVPA